MSEQETTYTVYCIDAEGKTKVIPNLKSQEEANRVAHHEIDTGNWQLVFSLDDKEKEFYYSPADEVARLQARIERLETALREITDPHLIMPFGTMFWQKAMKARKALESEDSE